MGFIPENVLVNLQNKINELDSSELNDRVTDLETTVGDNSSGLVKAVTDLETTVGDSSSGLVKDVSDLETTVGDNTSGLVKGVSDINTLLSNLLDFDTTGEKLLGTFGGNTYYKQVFKFADPIAAAGSASVNHGITNPDFKILIGMTATGGYSRPLSFAYGSNEMLTMYGTATTILVKNSASYQIGNISVIAIYSKTVTQQSREDDQEPENKTTTKKEVK